MHAYMCVCVTITDAKSCASWQTSDIYNGCGNTHFWLSSIK